MYNDNVPIRVLLRLRATAMINLARIIFVAVVVSVVYAYIIHTYTRILYTTTTIYICIVLSGKSIEKKNNNKKFKKPYNNNNFYCARAVEWESSASPSRSWSFRPPVRRALVRPKRPRAEPNNRYRRMRASDNRRRIEEKKKHRNSIRRALISRHVL